MEDHQVWLMNIFDKKIIERGNPIIGLPRSIIPINPENNAKTSFKIISR